MKRDYEVVYPLMYDGERVDRGSVVSVEEADAAPFVAGGTLRELPERASKPKGRPRKQESEDANEE